MKIKELMTVLEAMAPFSLQEEYDNAGLSLGDPETEINSCLVCLDVTRSVVEEAVSHSIPLIISHHPVIFTGLKRVIHGDPVADIITHALKNDVSLLSMHTNLDNIHTGVNKVLGEKLGLSNMKILRPGTGQLVKLVVFCPVTHADKVRSAIFEAGAGVIGNYDCCSYNVQGKGSFRANEKANPFVGKVNEIHFEEEVRIETILPAYLEKKVVQDMLSSHPYEEVAYDLYPLKNQNPLAGSGMIGVLPEELDETAFLTSLKKRLETPCLRHSSLLGGKVSRVAVCGGSGSFLLEDAIRAGADAFVTADIKYHQFMNAEGRTLFVDAGHFETEQFTVELIAGYLMDIFPNFAVHISKVACNPVKYL